MFYVYVLKSRRNGRHYTGFTSKNPEQRLKEHNSGSNAYTKGNRPYQLIYWEQYADKSFALKREKFLKSGVGRRVLTRKLQSDL